MSVGGDGHRAQEAACEAIFSLVETLQRFVARVLSNRETLPVSTRHSTRGQALRRPKRRGGDSLCSIMGVRRPAGLLDAAAHRTVDEYPVL